MDNIFVTPLKNNPGQQDLQDTYFCLRVFSVRGKRRDSAVLAELLEEELELALGLGR